VLGFATGTSDHLRDRRVWSCAQKELRFIRMIGRAARPVTHDRTRPTVEGAYWTLTRHGHYRIRSLREARPVMSLRARYCAIGASGRLSDASGRLTGASGHCVAGARVSVISASGRLKRRVWSFDGRVQSLLGAHPVIGLTIGGQ
jgi:hypothetical protein